MQWFIRTTEDLRERIEKLYRLDAALRNLENLSAEVDNVVNRIEKDLRPTKVQHEMRLRALEPMIDQVEEHTLRLSVLEGVIKDKSSEPTVESQTVDLEGIRAEFQSIIDGVRAELERKIKSLEESATRSESATSEPPTVRTPTVDLEPINAAIDQLRSELDGLKASHSGSTVERPTNDPEELRAEYRSLNDQLSMDFQSRLVRLASELEGKIKSMVDSVTRSESATSEPPTVRTPTVDLEPINAAIDQLRSELDGLKASHSGSTVERPTIDLEELRAEYRSLNDQLSTDFQSRLVRLASELEGKIKSMVDSVPRSESATSEPPTVRTPTVDLEPINAAIDQLRSELDGLKASHSGSTVESPTIDPEELRAEYRSLNDQLSTDFQSRLVRLASELEGKMKSAGEVPSIDLEPINVELEKFQNQLVAKDEEIKQLWQLFSERIESRESELEQLKRQAAMMATQLDAKNDAISELIRQVDYLWKKFDELEAAPTVESPSIKTVDEPTITETPASDDASDGPKIMQFDICARSGVYISGSPDEIMTKLKGAMNVDDMKIFLESAKTANKVIFQRSLDRHVRNLQKLTYKLNFDEYASGTASEEITRKYFEVFKLTLLESVTSTSYRGLARQPDFYREFLKHFNRYLSRCGIYTRRILPNDRVTERDASEMKIARRETLVASNNDLIAEVERLPYYIDYVTADGGTKSLCFEGKMTVYAAKR